MKKILSGTLVLLLAFTSITIFQFSCKKNDVVESTPTPTYQVAGLWVGTYTVGAGNPVPAGTSFFLSFSINPNGTMSYKSKGFYNGSYDYITFADGTWTLTGNVFAFTVVTINYAGGGAQHTQTGTATYNSVNGTFTNGTITEGTAANTAWTMSQIRL